MEWRSDTKAVDWLTSPSCLPDDHTRATLVGRVWLSSIEGPAVVAVRDGSIYDLSTVAPTCSQLLELDDPVAAIRGAGSLARIGSLQDLLRNSIPDVRDTSAPWLLAPCDLQAIKASGVTFVASLLERVIEEQARGDARKAESVRQAIVAIIGTNLRDIRPGSPQAAAVKEALIAQGVWSQYLEVGIGPDAEVFTKAPTLSSVGSGMDAGLHPKSTWNNPEPEVVLIVSAAGKIVGAALGNDVNLRDFEGRSALLLSKAKDNNASCAIGPLLRLFDQTFSLDDVRKMDVGLTVTGADGFVLEGHSSISKISRDPTDLVAQTIGPVHQYPDGFALFLGTMFAPVKDRDAKGEGFTHKRDDIVTIAAPQLGKLVNRMRGSDECEPWTFGVGALMKNLAQRKVL
jgi:fumarylacetoacetate (FAA) hydrolase family protein